MSGPLNLFQALMRIVQFLLVENWPITSVVVLAVATLYLLLPRPQGRRTSWGLAVGLLTLLYGGWMLLRPGPASGHAAVEAVLFYLFSAIAIVSGVLLVTQRNPARAALSFALVVLSTCGLFLLQGAPFLTASETIIYAGAIVVIFLFVLMLAQQEGASDADFRSREPFLASVAGFVLLGTILYVLQTGYGTGELDDVVTRARSLQAQVQALRERAAEQSEVAVALGDARPLVKLPKLDDQNKELEPPGEVEQLRADLIALTVRNFSGSDAGTGLEAARTAMEKAAEEVLGLVGRAERNQPVAAGDAQKALGNLEDGLGSVATASQAARNSLSVLQPAGDRPMSELSGPAANRPLAELRRDEQGRPHLPHENVAYLGRSLFSDYLLAVELGGTLLLVATIGAIAIAHARARPSPEKRS